MSTTTSPDPATGSGASPYCSLSVPPCPVSNIAFIRFLRLPLAARLHEKAPRGGQRGAFFSLVRAGLHPAMTGCPGSRPEGESVRVEHQRAQLDALAREGVGRG